MTLTAKDMDALKSVFGEMIEDAIAARVKAPRAQQATKVAKDTRTIAQRREAAAGGTCEEHGLRFATKGGARYHFARTDITHSA